MEECEDCGHSMGWVECEDCDGAGCAECGDEGGVWYCYMPHVG